MARRGGRLALARVAPLLSLVFPLMARLAGASSDISLLERLGPLYRWSVPSSTAHLYGVLPDAPAIADIARREGAEGALLASAQPGTAPLVALAPPALEIVLFTARPSAHRDLVDRAAFWHGFAAPASIARFHRVEKRVAERALREHAWRIGRLAAAATTASATGGSSR